MFKISMNHRVDAVVSMGVLRYKSEGRGFDWNFLLT